jgi:hypothetical protein
MMRLGRRGLAGFGALCKVIALSTVLTLALASAAFADDLTNLLDNSPDTAIGPLWLENMTLNEGQTGNVPFRLLSVNSDGESGCNISGSENLVVAFASTNASVAREEPSASTLTFQDGADGGTSACGPSPSGTPPASAPDDKTVTVKAVSRGTAEISLSQVSTTNTGSGTFTYGRAKFQVTVNNVAPTISNVPDQGTDEDNPTGAIPFTIGDAGTPASSLAVSGSSSNTTLVPNSNITFDGSGANRTITVTPEPNLSGTVTITVSVGDGAATTTDTFVLTVNATNDQPNAVDDTANANEGGSNVTVGVLANDGDVDGDALTITGNTQPPAGEGSVTCSTTSCTFAPDADFHGTTSFTYTASDGNGGTDTATVAVNVAATNDAPEANNDSYGVDEDGTLNVGAPGILANDTDVDDLLGPLTALTAALVNGSEDGTLALDADGSFAYTPDANFNGSDSFTYTASDGTANGNVSTVMINVAAVNDAPDFDLQTNPNQTVNEDAGTQTVVGFATNASAGPANESVQTVSFTVTNDNQALFSGQPTISPNGTLTYAPAADANGTANVTVTATDNGGTVSGGDNTSGERTFTITVNTVNDVPTLTLSGAANASEGQTKTYGFTVSDPDPGGFTIESGFPDCGDGGVLVVGSLTTTATGGSFECYFPDGPRESTVRVRVSDLQGEISNIATQELTIADVAPTITMSGPSNAKQGQTKTFTFAVTDPGEDTFDFAAGYPRCGNGAVLVGEHMGADSGSFQCNFVKPTKQTLVVGIEDLDGGLSNMASWQVKVKKSKVRIPFANERGSEATAPAAEDTSADR